jgi:hypothetical protein
MLAPMYRPAAELLGGKIVRRNGKNEALFLVCRCRGQEYDAEGDGGSGAPMQTLHKNDIPGRKGRPRRGLPCLHRFRDVTFESSVTTVRLTVGAPDGFPGASFGGSGASQVIPTCKVLM